MPIVERLIDEENVNGPFGEELPPNALLAARIWTDGPADARVKYFFWIRRRQQAGGRRSRRRRRSHRRSYRRRR